MSEVAEKPKTNKSHQGKLLRAMRHYKGKTQDQLAKEVNMSQSRIFELELMETVPDEALNKFADYYKVSIDFLKNFNLEEAGKNYTYNNHATISDNGSETSANQMDNMTINNPNSTKDLKEAYENLAKLSEKIGILETENKFLKERK
jgi:transcriptional regulator with XRE-family HTH domain